MSDKKATLTYDGKTIELDSLTGTENETGLDITKLRAETGLITLDPAYGNTGSCTSDITFIDGGKGILRYTYVMTTNQASTRRRSRRIIAHMLLVRER